MEEWSTCLDIFIANYFAIIGGKYRKRWNKRVQGRGEEEKERVKANDRMRKEAERQGQSEEEKKKRCATERQRLEEKREERSEEEKEQEKMEARQRMTAKRAKVASKPRDGLNAQMTLVGSFRVDTNYLGAMDEVS